MPLQVSQLSLSLHLLIADVIIRTKFFKGTPVCVCVCVCVCVGDAVEGRGVFVRDTHGVEGIEVCAVMAAKSVVHHLQSKEYQCKGNQCKGNQCQRNQCKENQCKE